MLVAFLFCKYYPEMSKIPCGGRLVAYPVCSCRLPEIPRIIGCGPAVAYRGEKGRRSIACEASRPVPGEGGFFFGHGFRENGFKRCFPFQGNPCSRRFFTGRIRTVPAPAAQPGKAAMAVADDGFAPVHTGEGQCPAFSVFNGIRIAPFAGLFHLFLSGCTYQNRAG